MVLAAYTVMLGERHLALAAMRDGSVLMWDVRRKAVPIKQVAALQSCTRRGVVRILVTMPCVLRLRTHRDTHVWRVPEWSLKPKTSTALPEQAIVVREGGLLECFDTRNLSQRLSSHDLWPQTAQSNGYSSGSRSYSRVLSWR